MSGSSSLRSESPDFTPMIDTLRTHHSVEVVISTSGRSTHA